VNISKSAVVGTGLINTVEDKRFMKWLCLNEKNAAKCLLKHKMFLNPLTDTLKPQNNRPLYSITVIGTLAVDGWVGCYIWHSEEGHGRAAAPPSPFLAVPNVTAHPSINGQCTNFILFDAAL